MAESTASPAASAKDGVLRERTPLEHGQVACSNLSCGTGSLRAAGRVRSSRAPPPHPPWPSSGQGHWHQQLLVANPLSQSALPPAAGRALTGDVAASHRHGQPLDTQTKRSLHCCGQKTLCCVALVVVVVRTCCLCDVSIHARRPHASNSGGRSLGSLTPGDPALLAGVNPGPVPTAVVDGERGHLEEVSSSSSPNSSSRYQKKA